MRDESESRMRALSAKACRRDVADASARRRPLRSEMTAAPVCHAAVLAVVLRKREEWSRMVAVMVMVMVVVGIEEEPTE